mmetsp:Transcript_49787/g.115566  ORF Transcript_49787/g.115566 Transcript_49787/m.115566 type:complete len:343 (+) Transcript_49787:1441-2469(+)
MAGQRRRSSSNGERRRTCQTRLRSCGRRPSRCRRSAHLLLRQLQWRPGAAPPCGIRTERKGSVGGSRRPGMGHVHPQSRCLGLLVPGGGRWCTLRRTLQHKWRLRRLTHPSAQRASTRWMVQKATKSGALVRCCLSATLTSSTTFDGLAGPRSAFLPCSYFSTTTRPVASRRPSHRLSVCRWCHWQCQHHHLGRRTAVPLHPRPRCRGHLACWGCQFQPGQCSHGPQLRGHPHLDPGPYQLQERRPARLRSWPRRVQKQHLRRHSLHTAPWLALPRAGSTWIQNRTYRVPFRAWRCSIGTLRATSRRTFRCVASQPTSSCHSQSFSHCRSFPFRATRSDQSV